MGIVATPAGHLRRRTASALVLGAVLLPLLASACGSSATAVQEVSGSTPRKTTGIGGAALGAAAADLPDETDPPTSETTTTTSPPTTPPPVSVVTSIVTVPAAPTTTQAASGGGGGGGGGGGSNGGGGAVAAPTIKASASNIPNPCTGQVEITWSSTGLTQVNVSTGQSLGSSGTQDFPAPCGTTTVFRFSGSNGGGSANANVTVNN